MLPPIDDTLQTMKTKDEIVQNWLPRYTGTPIEQFGEYILLTNFINYVELFAKKYDTEIYGLGRAMQTATADNITIINFGMGSAMAATVMDLLTAVDPKAVLFLGKCGGLKKRWSAIWFYRLRPFGATAPATITCGPKFRLCRRFGCNGRCRP